MADSPTSVTLSPRAWAELAEVLARKGLLSPEDMEGGSIILGPVALVRGSGVRPRFATNPREGD